MTYVDRFAGTLAGVRERLPYLRELGVSYLHLMPLLHARPQPNDGGYAVVDYGAVEPALGTMDDLRALADELRARGHGAVRRRGPQPHRARARVGAGRAGRRRAGAGLLPHVRRPRRARRLRAHAARRLPRHRARELHAGSRSSGAGSGPRSTPTSGISTTPTPRSSARWPRRCSGWPRPASTCCAWTPSPFLWKRMGTNCQNQPEVHELLQAFRAAHADRGAGRRLQGRGDRRPRATSWPTSAPAATRARSATSPTTTSSWCCCWSALASRARGADDDTLRAMPPVPPGAGWVTYVRCHDDIGWAITDGGRRRGRRGRPPAPALPGRLLRGRLPGHVRARRALPARPARPARRARAAPRPRWPGSRRRSERRRARAGARDPARPAAATRSPSPTAACR